MKKTIILLLVSTFAFSQTDSSTKEFLKQFIAKYTMNKGELVIVRSSPFKDSLVAYKSFEEKLTKFMKERNGIVRLTENEKLYILKNYIKSNFQEWTQPEVSNHKLVSMEESFDYMNLNPENSVLAISRPIFLRGGNIALVSYANVCYSPVANISGNTGLGFFKKSNGKWEELQMISSGGY